ncbi:hypothetical protein [Sphingobacterium cellulitidis]|uniref:hypothetical protein n=1 Tax=Sphingobacterium cellulitidis TaxID=1768011 RepID=UPI000B93B374|nr:hypothetical protein CHT99_10335 [Sphingobacterium cellulitidis]
MATVKFSDEMPKPTSIKGTDRFLISDGVTGEAKAPDFNQAKEYLNITGIEMEPLVGGTTSGTALVVPNGPAGEQRTAEVSSGKWYDFGSGPVQASADRRWKSYWNGTSWVLKDMGALPIQEGTDTIVDEEVPKGKAVVKYVAPTKEKVDSILEVVPEGEVSHLDVGSGTSFGSTVYGWGFPIKGYKNIKAISISLGSGGTSNSQRLVVKKLNESGEVLFDENFTKTISGTRTLYRFDLPSLIENTSEEKLWVEIFTNATVSIYRTSPAVVFTAENGYPFPRNTTVNDMGASGFNAGGSSAYYDVYHQVITEDYDILFNENAENQIIEIANSNIVVPAYVDETVDKVNEHIVTSLVAGEDYVPFVDGVGPQSDGNYKMGFPAGELQPFDKITIPVNYNPVRVLPTVFTINIRQVNKTGEIIATTTAPFPGGTGRVDTIFTFPSIVNPTGKVFIEVTANGQFGLHRRYPNPAVIFTEANGYPPLATSTTPSGALVDTSLYLDFWFKTNTYFEETVLQGVTIDIPEQDANVLGNENERISFTGSSVTWGDGYLQSGYVAEYIKLKQSKFAKAILASELEGGTLIENRQYFLGKARKITGIGQEFEFKITGNEVSIIQGIERSNDNASEIELYIDGNLHDTFNNFNPTSIGTFTKNFTGDGTAVMFDLGMAFTYGHTVTVAGASKVVTLNTTQNTGFSIPAGSDCAIIRRLGVDEDGNPAVTHWLWFKVAPTSGQAIVVNGTRAKALFYEKTTIGQDSSGNNESPYGDGDTSFDPLAPASIATGLDFRQTDERVVKIYRFLDNKERTVRLRIKGNYGTASGTPYFIFNFATNRYFHFQNAGIGGWDLWDLDRTISQDALRGWQRVIEFNPDKLVIETTPNDDWIVKGHKVYSSATLSLAGLRATKNLPLRSIDYNSGTDDYTMTRWRGFITAITEDSVTFSGTVDTPIAVGDVVMIGQYWGNNKDYIERIVSGISGNTISFNKPISKGEIIYNSLQDFVGKEIGVRSLGTFKTKLEGVIDKIRSVTDCPIYVLENPMPNVLGRELWGYPIIMDMVANSKVNVHSVDYLSLRKWQESQAKESTTLNVASAVLDPYLNKRVLEFGTNGQNLLSVDVLLNGESIYGKRAVVQNGWAYTVNQSATGAALNKLVSGTTNSGQVYNGRTPRLVILDDTLTSGTITVKWAGSLWSNDSCHMNANGSKLYADFLRDI